MRLIKSVSISLVAKLITVLIAFPTSIIIARHLGPSGRGIFAVLATLTGVALQFGNFGFHSSSIYFSTKNRNLIPSIAGILIVFGIIIGLIAGFSIILLDAFFPKVILGDVPYLFLIITLVALPFAFISQFLQNLLLGMQRIYEYNVVDVVAKALMFAIVILLFLVLNRGIFELILVTTLITVLSSLVYIYFTKRNTSIALSADILLIKRMAGYGLKAYIAALFAFLVIRSDMMLVNYFRGISDTGLYSLAVSLADLLLLIPATVGTMLFLKATAIGDEKSELTKKVSRHTVLLMGIVCLIAAVAAKPAIVFIYGAAFAPSVSAFLWILPGVFFLSLETIYMNEFASRGMPPIVYITPAIGFIINITLNIVLVPRIGFIAASITSSLAYFLMFVTSLIYFRNISGATYKEILVVKPGEVIEVFQAGYGKFLALKAARL